MPWEDLSKIALLGTDRTAISPQLKQQLEALGISPDTDSAKIILKGAAILQAQKKAGFVPPKWKEQIPGMDNSKIENLANSRSSKHLQLILDGTHAAAFEEFLDLMQSAGKTVAPQFIPLLLERALNDGHLRPFILTLIGERGKWLVQQNKKWADHFAPLALEEWDTIEQGRNLPGFQHMRINQPQEALALLEANWSAMNAKTKAAFLNKIKISLSNTDEKFLEVCLYETRKELRQTAAKLLSLLPDSSLNQRMWERLQDFVQIKKGLLGSKPIISLPDNIDETMLRDGIDPRHQWKSGGLKASRLGQMIVILPPKRWEEAYVKTPSELIQLFLQSDWAVLFIQAFSQAAIVHKNQEWMQAILSLWIKNNSDQRWQDFPVRQLLENIDADVFNVLCAQALKATSGFADEHDPLVVLIHSSRNQWSPDLSKTLIRSFQKWMAAQDRHHWGGWHYKIILEKAAYHSALEVQATLRKNWPTDAPLWSVWQREIEQFFSTLQFRLEMQLELVTKPI